MTRARLAARIASVLVLGLVLGTASEASAQMGGPPPGGGARGGAGGGGGATRATPTRNKNVGPRGGASGAGGDDDDDQGPSPSARPASEPTARAPSDPLAIPEGIETRIGSDAEGAPPPAEGATTRKYFPWFEQRTGDARVRLVPPLYLEHARGLDPQTGATTARTDSESLSGMVYYRRRSPTFDADVLFPLAWRVRDRENRVLALGPIAHREAPGEHDNWLAPLVFEGKRKTGGYFHSPALLTTSHWDEKGAFTLVGPYFRDRSGSDVDWGVAPFVFHGDNGDVDGNRKKYTLLPPLLYFNRTRELTQDSLTVVGPVVMTETPKRSVFDVAPLFFYIKGRPETGGVKESHLTLFPLFHYGESPEQKLFVLPGYLRRITPTSDTMLTPFYSHATTRNRATSLDVAGPILPVFWRKTDVDVGFKSLGIFPFYYGSHDPTGEVLATPLFARFESYNVSRTYWAFPNIVHVRDTKGWETDIHPIVYVGRSDKDSHTVFAPLYWDFASKKSRTTIGFPLLWRFADREEGSVTQVAGNTLYREKRRAGGGQDWEFHVLPLLSFGETPTGHWWNVLFGLAGYDHDEGVKKIKAFWLPIEIGRDAPPKGVATAR
jgi:hypothetical protein